MLLTARFVKYVQGQMYQNMLTANTTKKLQIMIIHTSEKPQNEPGHLPNASALYQQAVEGFSPYEVWLLPEHEGNLNWSETYNYLVDNFRHIPICLSVVEGGDDDIINVQLSVNQIRQANQTLDVRAIRIAELISWCLPEKNFTTEYLPYVREVLTYARNNNLKVIWDEWKIGWDVVDTLKDAIAGYEDIVTFTFGTNDEYQEPLTGYVYAIQFEHWGASVQSWYWWTRDYGTEMDMPGYLLVEHAVIAMKTGAEIIQIEPYKYFYDNGTPRQVMNDLMRAI